MLPSPITGWRNKKLISGEVHDDNCFVIHDFISHAGLFATVGGICRSLLTLNSKHDLLNKVNTAFKTHKEEDRYINGFDRPTDLLNTAAGVGCSRTTFGHLGFTGTSFWIDIEKMRGSVILTNATRNYWYDRNGLIEMRKYLGSLIWNS
jgi:CubicO group peptidase (beta-lactamase class C family)